MAGAPALSSRRLSRSFGAIRLANHSGGSVREFHPLPLALSFERLDYLIQRIFYSSDARESRRITAAAII